METTRKGRSEKRNLSLAFRRRKLALFKRSYSITAPKIVASKGNSSYLRRKEFGSLLTPIYNCPAFYHLPPRNEIGGFLWKSAFLRRIRPRHHDPDPIRRKTGFLWRSLHFTTRRTNGSQQWRWLPASEKNGSLIRRPSTGLCLCPAKRPGHSPLFCPVRTAVRPISGKRHKHNAEWPPP